MFLINFFKSFLQEWGWLNKSAKLLILGLDNAGKTTLLHLMRDNRLVQHKPTRNPTHEQMTMGNIDITALDVGGHREARKLWKDYFGTVDAIVYIIDAADPNRLNEAKYELNKVLSDDTLIEKPVVILGNKIDLDTALSEAEFRNYFGLLQTTGKGRTALSPHIRPLEVFMVCIAQKSGYGTAFQWLSQYL